MEARRTDETGREPDPIIRPMRGGLLALFLLAIGNGVFLYFFPSRAEPDYAWAIAPPISAAFIGAGYLAGMVAAGLSTFGSRYWRSVQALLPAFAALSFTALAATLIHADRFRWDYPLTWLWTAVYATLPLIAGYLWLDQRKVLTERPERDPRLGPWLPSWLLGGVCAAVAVILFIAPDSVLEEWPWPVTPLLARVFAGWYLLTGVGLLLSAASVARAHEVPVAYITFASWSVLVLLLPLLYPESIDTDAALYTPWLVLHGAILIASLFMLSRAVRVMRAEGQHL